MSEITTTMTRRGQVTIPKPYRDALRLAEGDAIAWDLVEGVLVLRRIGSVADATYAVIRPRKTPEDFEELREQYRQHRTHLVLEALESSASAEGEA